MIQIITKALDANNIIHRAEDAVSLARLSELLAEKNTVLNLTAVRTPEGIALRHIADSLTALPFIPQGASVADIGTGGGFPALPLALMRSDITVTAVDSTAKKLAFVAEAAEALGLSNLTTLCARAEELGRDAAHREKYDAVISRAVAAMPQLCELCLPLVRVGGVFVALKGAGGLDEAEAAKSAISTLGGGETDCTELLLRAPDGFVAVGEDAESARVIIRVAKSAPTPEKYPREWGRIRKKSL